MEKIVTTHIPRIFIPGDVPCQFAHPSQLFDWERPDAILLLGDLTPRRPLEAESGPILIEAKIRFSHGSHDTDSAQGHNHVSASSLTHWHRHGTVEDNFGIRIAGVNGVFWERNWMPLAHPVHRSYAHFFWSLDDKRPLREHCPDTQISNRQERLHCGSIFPDDVDVLASHNGDILMTHEAPSCHPNGFAVMDSLAQAMRGMTLFHDHRHQWHAYRNDRTTFGFRAYGVTQQQLMPLGAAGLEPICASTLDALLGGSPPAISTGGCDVAQGG
jgi:hypothetical protein